MIVRLALMGAMALLLTCTVLGQAPMADAAADPLLTQGVQDLQAENYEEALAAFTRSWSQGPHTAEKAYYLGLTSGRLGRYEASQSHLEEAVRLNPDYSEARLALADLLVNLEKSADAQEHLEYLRARNYQPAHTALLSGQAAFQQKNYSQAVTYLREAETDPAFAQQAKLQLGLALEAQHRYDESRRVLQEAVTVNPDSLLAGYAQRQVSVVERRQKDTQPFHAQVSSSFEYDTNVTLQSGQGGAQVISGQGDTVFTQLASLDYQFFPHDPFGLMVQYSIFQNFHRRITPYDVLSHTAGITPSYRFSQGTLWFPFTFNYMDVGSDKYYTGYVLSPTYLHMVTPKIGLEAGMFLARNYYWYPLPFAQEDRSGKDIGGSLGAYYFLKNQKGYLQARFSYLRDATGGSNWDSSIYRLLFAALYPVTENFKVNGFLELTLQPYDHNWFNGNPLVSNPKRQDKTLLVGVGGTYNIYKGLELNLHYYFVRDNSNLPLYDYHRHIMGGTIAYKY